MIVRFVDINGIVDHHCSNFLFMGIFSIVCQCSNSSRKPLLQRKIKPICCFDSPFQFKLLC